MARLLTRRAAIPLIRRLATQLIRLGMTPGLAMTLGTDMDMALRLSTRAWPLAWVWDSGVVPAVAIMAARVRDTTTMVRVITATTVARVIAVGLLRARGTAVIAVETVVRVAQVAPIMAARKVGVVALRRLAAIPRLEVLVPDGLRRDSRTGGHRRMWVSRLGVSLHRRFLSEITRALALGGWAGCCSLRLWGQGGGGAGRGECGEDVESFC
jgi:hypothetical protein